MNDQALGWMIYSGTLDRSGSLSAGVLVEFQMEEILEAGKDKLISIDIPNTYGDWGDFDDGFEGFQQCENLRALSLGNISEVCCIPTEFIKLTLTLCRWNARSLVSWSCPPALKC